MQAPSADERISRLAARQNALITADQLRAAGLSRRAIDYRVGVGRLHVVHRGVYGVGHPPLTIDADYHAAVLAVGPDAVLSHVSAAVLWGLIRPLHRTAVDVATTRCLRPRPGIHVHVVRNLAAADVTRRQCIPVTAPARTLADIAGVVAPGVLRRAVREAEVQRLTDLEALAKQLRAGRRGTARLRALTAPGPVPTRSELEDRALDLLVSHDFPRPLVNATVRAAGRTHEVDFLFAEHRLIIEADGERYHGTRLARERDAAKQAALEAAGYRVVRLTWHQVARDARQTVERLRQIIPPRTLPER